MIRREEKEDRKEKRRVNEIKKRKSVEKSKEQKRKEEKRLAKKRIKGREDK